VNDDLRIRQALLDAALADFHHTDQTDIPSSPFQHSSRTRTYHQNLSPLIQQTLFNSTTCHMHGGAAQPEDSDFSVGLGSLAAVVAASDQAEGQSQDQQHCDDLFHLISS
jgi:hypothetical protein